MHKSLAEALLLGESVVSVRHLRELGIHTGVPASVTDHAVSGVKVLNVIALAGGTYECTCTTTEAIS